MFYKQLAANQSDNAEEKGSKNNCAVAVGASSCQAKLTTNNPRKVRGPTKAVAVDTRITTITKGAKQADHRPLLNLLLDLCLKRAHQGPRNTAS